MLSRMPRKPISYVRSSLSLHLHIVLVIALNQTLVELLSHVSGHLPLWHIHIDQVFSWQRSNPFDLGFSTCP